MNNLKQIQKKQNEEKMLRCQFAARECFNQAEMFFYISWLFSILSALTVFLPSINSLIIVFAPLGIDIVAYLSHYIAERRVKTASLLRNFFDCVVFNIHLNTYQGNAINHIWELVDDICNKYLEKCHIQINHTSRDVPPGVKNWYEFSTNTISRHPVFECQSQNCWWNKKLCRKRHIRFIVFLCSLIITSILINIIFGIGWLRMGLCFGALIVNFVDLIRANIEYQRLSLKMDTILETPEIDRNPLQIEHLQELICRRRELLVLEINALHKKYARLLSETYERINQDTSNTH